MLDDSALGQPYDHAVARLHAAGGDLQALPVPLRTLLMVESAQSFIDSGGLAYFYEADFPNQPPYSAFVEAYRLIGADEAAECIERTSLMFPFSEPHLFEPLRQMWLEKLAADPAGEFVLLSERISGDPTVWERLGAYVRRNLAAFS